METKRFIGNDMTRLYERVRKEFGPDAIIVRTRSLLREGAEPLIELLAAPPTAEPEVPLELQWQMLDRSLNRLQNANPRATIGDLEDMVAREAPAAPAAAPAPGWDDGPAVEHEFVPGPLAPSAQAEPALFAPDEDPFAGLFDEMPETAEPPPPFAARPRPVLAGPSLEPDDDFAIDFTAAAAERQASLDSAVADALRAAGLSDAAASRAAALAPGEHDPERALASALGQLPLRFPEEFETALVTIQGPPGAGRTSALLRMALDCADAGREAVLVAADTTRAAAREQLHAYAGALDLRAYDAREPHQLARLMSKVSRGACLFVDVPAGPFAAPAAFASRHYAYLALPAHWQYAAIEGALRAFVLESFAGCVLTGADIAPNLSPALSLALESNLGVAFLSSGRDISTGIQIAEPSELASGFLRAGTGETTNGRLTATA